MTSDHPADWDALSDGQLLALKERVGEAGAARIDAYLGARRSAQRAITAASAGAVLAAGIAEPPPATPCKREMNGWERQYLDQLKARPDVQEARFEAVRVRLADGAWYKSDFFVVLVDGRMELHEVKGLWRTAARVRIKVAARLYPWFRFVAVRKRRKRDGGGWTVEQFAERLDDL